MTERYDLLVAARDLALVEADRLEESAVKHETDAQADRTRARGLRELHSVAVRYTETPVRALAERGER